MKKIIVAKFILMCAVNSKVSKNPSKHFGSFENHLKF